MAAALLTTAACALDVLSPFSLYFSWTMVYEKGQVGRISSQHGRTAERRQDEEPRLKATPNHVAHWRFGCTCPLSFP